MSRVLPQLFMAGTRLLIWFPGNAASCSIFLAGIYIVEGPANVGNLHIKTQ
jgi:hypothetical protein